MNVMRALFGEGPALLSRSDRITAPPLGAQLRKVKAKASPAKRAWLAEARAGKDFNLAHGPGDHSVVRRDIFRIHV